MLILMTPDIRTPSVVVSEKIIEIEITYISYLIFKFVFDLSSVLKLVSISKIWNIRITQLGEQLLAVFFSFFQIIVKICLFFSDVAILNVRFNELYIAL